MRRKATILDVLREANERGSESPAAEGVRPLRDRPRGNAPAASAQDETPQESPAPVRSHSDEEGDGRVARWLQAPVHLTRWAGLLCGLVVVLGFWAAFALGVTKGVNQTRSGTEDLGARQQPDRGPARMAKRDGDSVGRAAPANSENAGSPARVLHGFRIVTYDRTPESRRLALSMRRHLRQHLAATGASDQWTIDGGKLVVVVAFPEERFEDTAWQDELWKKIRVLPVPAWAKGFSFENLQRSKLRGRLR